MKSLSTRYLLPAAVAALCCAPVPAHAAMEVFNANPEFPAPPPDAEAKEANLRGQIALGFSATSGNTDTTNLNARFLLGYKTGHWRHTGNVTGHRSSVDNATIAERYVATAKSDYSINEHDYLFATAQYETDRFAGFDRRTSEAVGYGRHLFKTEKHGLDGELGLGARQVRFEDGGSENEAIVRVAADYQWTISETAEFTQKLVVESGRDNTYTEAVSALSTRLIASIFSTLSFTVKRNDTVPEDRRKTDTFTAIQLEYRF